MAILKRWPCMVCEANVANAKLVGAYDAHILMYRYYR